MNLRELKQVTFLKALKETMSVSSLVIGPPIPIVAVRHITNQYGDSILLLLKDKCISPQKLYLNIAG